MENSNNDTTSIQTFLTIGNPENPENPSLEIDLCTFRERNVEMRFLGFTFKGTNPKTDEPQTAFINILTEEEFLVIKKFFAQLEWNS